MRIALPDPESLSPRQAEIYDAIVSGPRGGVRGPLAVWLTRPELAATAQALGRYCRYETSLSAELSELAILVTARVWSSEYEWATHKPIALKAGISEAVVDAIRDCRAPIFEDEKQRAVHDFAMELNTKRHVSEDLYAVAKSCLGEEALVDLVGILGYYSLISMTINAFEVPGPAGIDPEMTPAES